MRVNSILSFFICGLFLTSCNQSSGPAPEPPAPIIYGKEQLFEAPLLNGEFAVASHQFHWIDESREEPHTATTNDKREVLVRIYYPAENYHDFAKMPVYDAFRWQFWESADNLVPNHRLRRSNYLNSTWPVYIDAPINTSKGFYPLVIFSHGYGFSPEEHLVLAADLASRGFIVASINHPFGSSYAKLDDGSSAYAEALPRDNLGIDLPLWSDDQLFVLDQMEQLNQSTDSFLYSKIDMSQVATSGHSYGGAAAYYAAWKDSRITAAIDIDGTIFNPENKNISIPFMLMQSGPGDSYEIFEQVANDGYGVAFKNTIKHHSFADYVLFWRWDFPEENPFGPLDSELALKTSVDIIEQFLNKYGKNTPAPLLDDAEQLLDFTRVVYFD